MMTFSKIILISGMLIGVGLFLFIGAAFFYLVFVKKDPGTRPGQNPRSALMVKEISPRPERGDILEHYRVNLS